MPGSPLSVRIDSCAVVITNSDCSCDNCDSVTCFTRRRKSHDNCSCFECHQSKTCPFLAQNFINIDEWDSAVQCNECSLFTKCKHVKSSGHLIKKKTETIIKRKFSDKSCGKEVDYDRIEQPKSPIKMNAMNDVNGGINTKESFSFGDTASSVKSSRTTVQSSRTTVQSSRTTVQSSLTTILDDGSPTGKLSAQIMNVSYTDYKKSVYNGNSGVKLIKWTTEDILNKIKEAYKACSCKVCECITKSSFLQPTNDPNICNCKPCECADCSNKINKSARKSSSRTLYMKTYKEMEIIKVNEKCNCKPCQCVQCKLNARKICDCKPCERVQSKGNNINCTNIKGTNSTNIIRTVVVAPVGEDSTREVCTCTPSNCMTCGRTLGSTSMTHEMSTGMSRTRNCRCETCLNDACFQDGTEICQCSDHHEIMRKPVIKDCNDYDIHSAFTDSKFDYNKDNKSDAITMCAPLASKYSSHTNNRNNDDCKCKVCECMVCKDRCGSTSSTFLLERKVRLPVQTTAAKTIKLSCKCSPCECIMCQTKDHLHGRGCKCKVCECLTCVYSATRPIRLFNYKPRGICKCKPCECIDCCQQMISCVVDNRICNENTYHKFQSYERKRLRLGLHNDGYDQKHDTAESCNTNQTVGLITYVNPNNVIVSKFDLNKNPKSVEEVDRVLSVRTSRLFGTNGDSRNVNNIVSKKQILSQSSCNSSSHDDSDYLMKFPRSAVETCINDVLKFNLDKTLNLTRFEVSSNGNFDTEHARSPQYSIYCNKIKSQAGEYSESLRDVIGKPMPSDDYNLAEGCKCSSRDYEKCSFGMFREQRRKCDCMACDCIESCISKDKSLFIGKNVNTQTKEKKIIDRGQDSLNTNHLSIDMFKRDFIKFSSELCPLKTNHIETGRNQENITMEQNKLRTYDSLIESPPKSPDNGDSNTYNMPKEINYNSVKTTIQEAKKFSLELLQILQKYEKANREFKSISQKLTLSQEFMFDKTTLRNVAPLETKSKRENGYLSYDQLVHTQIKIPSMENKHNQINREDLAPEANNKNKSVAVMVYKSLHEIASKDISESFQENKIRCNEIQNTTEPQRKGIEPLSNYVFDEKYKKIFDDTKKIELKERYTKYRKLIKRAVSISRRFQINSKKLVVTKSAEVGSSDVVDALGLRDNITITGVPKDYIDSQVNVKNNKQELESTSKLELTENEITVTDKPDNEVMQINDPLVNVTEKEEPPTQQIGKTTIDFKPPDENNNSCYESETYSLASGIEKDKSTPVEADVKNAIFSITRQMSDDNNINNPQRPHFGNHALETLHMEVQKLLNKPQIQIQGTTYYFSEPAPSARIEPATSNNCDAMKVSFYGVRRVSDHTILVKWNPPRDMKDVQGYELLVDGHAVQKILSRTRCMAVVTCLPHSERVLLTVRTITALAPSTDSPTASFLYRPRVK